MDIKGLILKKIVKSGEARVADIVKITGFSRAYINRFFQELKNSGKIALIGKANRARYVSIKKANILKLSKEPAIIRRIFKNENLFEDIVFDEIKKSAGSFLDLSKNIMQIFSYAFTKMFNNAIEHSRSDKIGIFIKKNITELRFDIIDKGVGIFNNIIKKRKLKTDLEAIQDLIKGKQTTAPKEHTGEGIFFTSKAGDIFTIQSSKKKLIFNNIVDDIFIKDIKNLKGTKVSFIINLKSKRDLNNIFKEYAGELFEFSKTRVVVKLYKADTEYISRSQARRILSGLEKFKTIILDFRDVDIVGQAFADEIFRVWKAYHSGIEIYYQNANENTEFMIKRALNEKHSV